MKTNWIKKVLSVVLAGAMTVCLAAAVFFNAFFPQLTAILYLRNIFTNVKVKSIRARINA